MAWRVKPLSTMLAFSWAPVQVPVVPLPVQLSSNAAGRTAEDGPVAWAAGFCLDTAAIWGCTQWVKALSLSP